MTLSWQKTPPLTQLNWVDWLTDKNSFMQRLIKFNIHNAQVNVLQENWQIPHAWESHSLKLKGDDSAFVREVLIQNDQQFFMFARTILPKNLLNSELVELFHLENRPLGSALFTYPNMQRHDLYFARVTKGMYLYDRASEATQTIFLELYARYSIFTLNLHSLLLTEVFLPGVLNHA